MTVGTIDFDNENDAISLAGWGLQSGLWDGRPISWHEASLFYEKIQASLIASLFKHGSPDFANPLAALTAWAGTDSSQKHLLEKEIQALDFSNQDRIIQAGFCKSAHKFWEKHKTAIVIGTTALAVVIVVAVVAISTAGAAAGGAIAAGGATLNRRRRIDVDKESQKGSSDPAGKEPLEPTFTKTDSPFGNEISLTSPLSSFSDLEALISLPPAAPLAYTDSLASNWKLELLDNSAKGRLLFLENGVILDQKYSSYQEILKPVSYPSSNLPEDPLPNQKPWIALGCEIVERNMIDSDVLDPTDFFPIEPTAGKKSWLAQGFEAVGRNLIDSDVLNHKDAFPPPEFSFKFATLGNREPHLRIGGINGMNNSLEEVNSHADYIKTFTPDLSVDWVYNRSHGPIADAVEVLMLNFHGNSPNTSDLLQETWFQFDNDNADRPNAKYLLISHSQGAIHTLNALQKAPEHIRNRVIVVAIAPGAVIPDDLCFKSYNFVCKGDPVPYGEAALARKTYDLESNLRAPDFQEKLEKQKELIVLEQDLNYKGSPHDFQNPVFYPEIKDIIEDYLNKNGEFE